MYGCDIHGMTHAMQKDNVDTFSDGVHLSDEGQDAVAENVTSMIEMFLSHKNRRGLWTVCYQIFRTDTRFAIR